MCKNVYTIALFLLIVSSSFAMESISIITNANTISNSISSQAINDCVNLLQKACNCRVGVNNPQAEILLKLPVINDSMAQQPSKFAKDTDYPYLNYPNHHYQWISRREDQQIILRLETPSYQGISFGLYGLLQEQLWFQFYHPKTTQIPNLRYWPLTEEFVWKAEPRFDKKGFHLHSQYPIEMTEPLMDHQYPDGQQELRDYVDWLVRNQQNYFEFSLLESVESDEWIPYMKEAVRYAKSRGLLVGVSLSLHSKQEKTFNLYKRFPESLVPKKKQIEKRLDWLAQVDWDVYHIAFFNTVATKASTPKRQALEQWASNLITNKHKAALMIKMNGSDQYLKGDENTAQPTIALIQTVMFYAMLNKKAAFYQNDNEQNILENYEASTKKRETWYYPEATHWVNFDNAIPMTLLPYLTARLADIELLDSLGCKGHVSSSSGWEWGYWLVDWSIARWSWKHNFTGLEKDTDALEYLAVLMQNDRWSSILWEILDVQEKWVKNQELIRYMTATTIHAELPDRLNKLPRYPKPTYNNLYYMKKAAPYQLDTLKNKAVLPLNTFAQQSDSLLAELQVATNNLSSTWQRLLAEEIWRGLKITSLRARHRACTLALLIEKAHARLKKTTFNDKEGLFEQAKDIRRKAQILVQQQEEIYRYPASYITKAFESHTAYDFGYLYMASNLHFWKKEEDQLRLHRFGIFYKNIWDLPRILGIVD